MRSFVQFLQEQRDNGRSEIAHRTNTGDDEADNAYAWLKTNHPDVHQFITRDAPVPLDPVQTMHSIRAQGKERTMQMFRWGMKQDTERFYPNYPL